MGSAGSASQRHKALHYIARAAFCAPYRSAVPRRVEKLGALNPSCYLQQLWEHEAVCETCSETGCFHHYVVALGKILDPCVGYQPSLFQAKPSASCSRMHNCSGLVFIKTSVMSDLELKKNIVNLIQPDHNPDLTKSRLGRAIQISFESSSTPSNVCAINTWIKHFQAFQKRSETLSCFQLSGSCALTTNGDTI